MANISALSPQLNRKTCECICVIETPKNSRRKYKLDESTGLFKLSSVLPEGFNFPFDFGFIPSTLAEDGDPIDVMVLADDAGVVGTLTDIRLIGVIHAEQREDGETKQNDRLLAIPVHAHYHQQVADLRDLDKSIVKQIESFFLAYTKLQGKKVKLNGCSGPRAAVKLVANAMESFKDNAD
jgi:inorganic pyrophosphatase